MPGPGCRYCSGADCPPCFVRTRRARLRTAFANDCRGDRANGYNHRKPGAGALTRRQRTARREDSPGVGFGKRFRWGPACRQLSGRFRDRQWTGRRHSSHIARSGQYYPWRPGHVPLPPKPQVIKVRR